MLKASFQKLHNFMFHEESLFQNEIHCGNFVLVLLVLYLRLIHNQYCVQILLFLPMFSSGKLLKNVNSSLVCFHLFVIVNCDGH